MITRLHVHMHLCFATFLGAGLGNAARNNCKTVGIWLYFIGSSAGTLQSVAAFCNDIKECKGSAHTGLSITLFVGLVSFAALAVTIFWVLVLTIDIFVFG